MTTGSPSSSVLRRLLEAAGYRLEDRPAGIKAVRARDHRAVFIVAGLRSPMEVESEFRGAAVHGT
jgi:hypothetical protein